MDVNSAISSLTLGGVNGLQTLTNTSRTLTVNQASVVNAKGVLGLSNGTVNGTGSLSINGVVQWNGGTSGSGFPVTVQPGGAVNIGAAITIAGPFINSGTVNWLNGNLSIYTNGTTFTGEFWNQPGALFDIQCNFALSPQSAPANFHNAGLLRKSGGSSSTPISVNLINTGTIQAQVGVIAVQGSYAESAAATLAISLAGLTPNSGFGKIQFTEAPRFAGKFAINTLSGYRPKSGDSFLGLSYPSFAGGITDFNGLDLGGGILLAPHLAGSGLTLVASGGSADLAGIALS